MSISITNTSHQCPHCKQGNLKEISNNHSLCGYYCPDGCKSAFDIDWQISISTNKAILLAKRRNPKLAEVMNSDDIVENLRHEAGLRANGELTHTHIYPLEVITM